MQALRAFISWIFALAALSCLSIAINYARLDFFSGDQLERSSILSRSIVPVFFTLQSLIFCMAWWTAFKKNPAMRRWGTSASTLLLLAGLFPVVLSFWFDHDWSGLRAGIVPISIVLAVGAVGLVAFARRV